MRTGDGLASFSAITRLTQCNNTKNDVAQNNQILQYVLTEPTKWKPL